MNKRPVGRTELGEVEVCENKLFLENPEKHFGERLWRMYVENVRFVVEKC